MSVGLAFERLNLRFNPFGELDAEDRATLAVADAAPLLSWLRPRRALQVLGACGSGKTSLLLAIRRERPSAAWIRGDAWDGRLPQAATLLVDEAQFLPRDARRRLWSRDASIAFSSHEDLSAELGTLAVRTVRLEGLDVDRLADFASRRIAFARRGPGRLPCVPRRVLEELRDRHGGDVRAIESELYEAVQRLERVSDVEV